MHEGHCCSELGVPGWPALAEELMVHRDIELARLTGAPHPPAPPVDRRQRRAGAPGQGRRRARSPPRSTPHHLSLTDESLRGFDPVFKVNPPLRTKADIEALVEGVVDGTIDAIATDHAPHPASRQGAAARRGAARDGRAGDRARRVPADAARRRDVARRGRRGAVVAAGGDRRSRRPARRVRSPPERRPTSSCSTRRRRGRSCRRS